jgi:anionic cell wall polymer biosynthesis LytR-Cps2A-Psr (LCP) family protein/uncharacterized protein YraI
MKPARAIRRISTLLFLAACVIAAPLSPATAEAPRAAQAAPPRQDPTPAEVPIPGQARKIEFPDGTVNIALLGVDKRPDKSFNNTDVIIIASINTNIPAVTLLSIPRDTPAYIPGVGVRKINTAYAAGGADLFKQTILYNYGIEVVSYALVNFTGVVHAVDTLGGVDVIATCPLQHIFPRDPYYMGDPYIVRQQWTDSFTGEVWPVGSKVPRTEINLSKPGVYTLDGLQSLAYVRARKGIPGGDVDRGRREQRLVRAMLQKAKQTGSISKLTELYTKLKTDVETDMTLETILRFAVMADNLGDTLVRSRYLVGYDANGAALPDAPNPNINRQQYIEQALTVALNQTVNQGPTVELLNGTNDAGFVAAAADRLKEVGFRVIDVRNADKPYATSVVIDHHESQKSSKPYNALIERTFDVKTKNIVHQPSAEGPRYTVVVGSDFNTCYFAKTLEASGSEKIEASTNPEQTARVESLPSTIVVTTTTEVAKPIIAPAVAVTATKLLSNTASSHLAPALSDDNFVPTMNVQQGDLVNVRSGPGIRFRTIGRLTGGQSAQILGRSYDGDWLNIQLPKTNRLGWVKAEVVKVVNAPPPPTPEPVQATAIPVDAAQATETPIAPVDEAAAPRPNATETPIALALVPTSTRPPRDAQPTPDAQPTLPPLPSPTPSAVLSARVTVPRGDVVNLRSGPGLTFRVIGRLFALQSAQIIGRSSDGRWWQVRAGRSTAWVAAGIVRTTGDLALVPVTR